MMFGPTADEADRWSCGTGPCVRLTRTCTATVSLSRRADSGSEPLSCHVM